jgi:hypothetical protein
MPENLEAIGQDSLLFDAREAIRTPTLTTGASRAEEGAK